MSRIRVAIQLVRSFARLPLVSAVAAAAGGRRGGEVLAERRAGQEAGARAELAHRSGGDRPEDAVLEHRDDEGDGGDGEQEAGDGVADLGPRAPGERRP